MSIFFILDNFNLSDNRKYLYPFKVAVPVHVAKVLTFPEKVSNL